MKNAIIGNYLLWEGKPAKVIWETDKRLVVIELLEDSKCPHCGDSLGKEQIHMIVSSPLFQQNAQPMQTIDNDPTLIIR